MLRNVNVERMVLKIAVNIFMQRKELGPLPHTICQKKTKILLLDSI
jgi:hypothetical protein